MENSLLNFMKSSKGFAKNPLGIIALFISLIYGFACIVLSTSIDNFKTACERLPLIWFIILFPVLILWVFVYLVKNHHEKLYAPGDFRNEENFLKSMDKNSQSAKINEEINTIVEDEEEVSKDTNAEPRKMSPSDISSLKQNYLLAEEFAIKEFGIKYNVSLNRNMLVKVGKSGKRFEFDGIGENNGELYLVEVKFATLRYLSDRLKHRIKDFINEIISNEDALSHGMVDLRPVIIIVSESDNNSSIKRELEEYIKTFDYKIIGMVYSFGELKRSYGIE
ncbi:MAG: hypothetical protein JW870_17560 [Candidatus Delongbacteria bacterium]|nr:hypothetical protein [Candidatus Delongbacteria bacterium]